MSVRKHVRAAWGLLCAGLVLTVAAVRAGERVGASERPNLLWISVEDMSPDLGCYGAPGAVTPHLDRFAAQSMRFTHAFSNSPVCAPSRSTLITGRYCTSIGTHQMRCQGAPPVGVRCFPEYLREAGYYCTNNVKTDYQFPPPRAAWDESSNRAHWRNRAPGQPFFAVFNITTTHESQVRSSAPELLRRLATLGPGERHDPTRAVLPPYYPDTSAVRRDWARNQDLITLMDREVGALLAQLEHDGLADNTIVWFWSDHGRGLPRAKRWVYDSGTHVPLIIRAPERLRSIASPGRPEDWHPGGTRNELISFVDFAPTVLSLAGIRVPRAMQGQPFLGVRSPKARRYVYAHRDRMDEAPDLIRSVRDHRYRYIRNFMPHMPYSQDIAYMNEMPTMREWRRLAAAGQLTGSAALHFRPRKPVEELFDCRADPHQVRDLAQDPAHRVVLRRMRRALGDWMAETRDVGLIPEPEFDALKREGDEPAQAATPTFALLSTSEHGARVRVTSATPGASVLWTLHPGAEARWRLLSGPIQVAAGLRLRAQASRTGFRDSPEAGWQAGDAPAPPRSAGVGETGGPLREEWPAALARSGVLRRLREFRDLDVEGASALSRCYSALRDPEAPVRYWAVVRIHTLAEGDDARQPARTALRPLLSDGAAVVRIAAARALCDLGEGAAAVPVLVKEMRNPSDSARLHAALVLGGIGEQARPAISQFRGGLRDRSEYVKRVCESALRRLGVTGENTTG